MTTMRQFLHLLGHDLSANWPLLLAWAVLLVLHPVLSVSTSFGWNGSLPMLAFVLVIGRLSLVAALIGRLAQSDSPIDPAAFWRTRPIPATTMGLAKVCLIVLVFVVTPLAVVTGVAAVFGVPRSHWPSMIVQVAIEEGSLALLTLLIASRTRHVAALIVALVATVLAGSALPMVLRDSLAALATTFGSAPPPHDLAWPTFRAWSAVGLLGLCVLAWHGQKKWRGLAVATAFVLVGSVLACAASLLRPFHAQAAAIAVGARLDPARIRAEGLPGAPHLVGIVAEPILDGVRAGDRTQAFLLDGVISWPGGSQPARGPKDPRMVVRSRTHPQSPLVAVLPRDRFATLAGRPVQFVGRMNIEVLRSDRVAGARLAPGLILEAAHARVLVDRLVHSTDRPRPVAEGLTVTVSEPGSWRVSTPRFRLRDRTTGCAADLYAVGVRVGDFHLLPLLPTTATPFLVQRVRFTVMQLDLCAIDPRNADLEIHDAQYPQVRAVEVRGAFNVPTTIEPPRVAVWDR